ncbi:hypothetical protein O6H91_03G099600 [Diphasiastrum complanatum]|uniref:Uncharacterized protein n=1 Tax=Diphasiastrum complanatum TaxID=34168 RepID=A0ACC2E9L3_DIPCM|nr:hypothetical protein O6H91_03G099600 [Diphasiastrum complanatum]
MPLEFKLIVDKPVLLKPSSPTERTTLFLSNVDHVVVFMVDTLYFYKGNGETEALAVVDKMKKALENLLVHYHFIAGRLRPSSSEAARLEVDCNSAGVLFAAAKADCSIQDLGDLAYPHPNFRKFLLKIEEAKALPDSPLMTLQVTSFRCGSFSLGVSICHALLDGYSAIHFLKNFASIARGQGLQLHPNPDRTIFKARSPPQPTHDFSSDHFTPATSKQAASSPPPPLRNSLKCTRFEAVAAFLWQARTIAMRTAPLKPSLVFFAVDKVQESLKAVTDEYVRAWNDWWQIWRGVPDLRDGFYLSSWWRFAFHELDFGWGKPLNAGPAPTAVLECVVLLPDAAAVASRNAREAGVRVLITLEPHMMPKFEEIVSSLAFAAAAHPLFMINHF